MKEKQFDHIENKIREAAENSEPNFDESAWTKMEVLLDKENTRKRPIVWIILPLLFALLISGYFLWNKYNVSNDVLPLMGASEKVNNSTVVGNKITNQKISDDVTLLNNVNPNNDTVHNVHSSVTYVNKIPQTPATTTTTSTASSTSQINSVAQGNSKYKKNKKAEKGTSLISITAPEASNDDNNLLLNSISNLPLKVVDKVANFDEHLTTSTLLIDTMEISDRDKKLMDTITDTKFENSTSTNKKESKQSKQSRFYYIAAVGMETTDVKFLSSKNGTVAPKFGFGIGYQLNNKFSIQTGFNASHKKYIATAQDYNVKPGTYLSTVDIIKVDANCLVYEIPISVRYNAFQNNSNSFYATVGLSSFIMKREDYKYDYIHNNIPNSSNWTYTGNENLFSIITLSAGYDKKLKNGFYIFGEPSISIPIAGVGDGKVKLYSMGIQLGVKYQPFKKRK